MDLHDLYLISPQIAMAGMAGIIVLLDMFVENKRVVMITAFLGLAAPLALSLILWFNIPDDNVGLFGALIVDRFSLFFHILFVTVGALVFLSSARYQDKFEGFRGEFAALMMFSLSGMMLLASARELITMFVALELISLPMAALIAFLRDDKSSEAGLKFLLMSAISSAILLFGVVYIYGFTGTTFFAEIFDRVASLQASGALDPDVPFGSYALLFGIVLLFLGLAFKLSAVPAQMWVPDIYEGGPTPVVAFLSVASKAAGFAIVLRLIYAALAEPALSLDIGALFAVLAAVTMTLGNFMALRQANIKRLLGYSTIAQAGYIMVGVAAVATSAQGGGTASSGPQGVLFFLVGYGFTNLAVFFAIIAITNRTGDDMISGFAGMARRSPVFAAILALGLLSLLGMPPTVGFIGKAFIFNSAVNADLLWLAVLAMVNSAVSAFYYLRIVRTMYLDDPLSDDRVDGDFSLTLVTSLTAAGVLVFGVAPWFLLRFAEVAIDGLAIG